MDLLTSHSLDYISNIIIILPTSKMASEVKMGLKIGAMNLTGRLNGDWAVLGWAH
jgi:hypothetical protein